MASSGPETRIVKAIIGNVRSRHNGHARKVHGSQYQPAGEPDVDAVIAGRAIKVEVKQPGKAATPRQEVALEQWGAAGAVVGVVHSLDEFLELLALNGIF